MMEEPMVSQAGGVMGSESNEQAGAPLESPLGEDEEEDMEEASIPKAKSSIFSDQEHHSFVEGVELYAASENAWSAIAAHVRTRTTAEIKAHASYYLMSLQSRNPDMQMTQANWSPEENALFETALAQTDEGDPHRWHKIAKILPSKTPLDIQHWYARLLGDLLDIERGA